MAKERALGMIGKKLGMTQTFDGNGHRHGVTAVELGPNVVMQKKDKANDGYSALQLGYHDIKDKHATKAQIGHAKKADGKVKRYTREFRVSEETAGKYELGATVSCDLFKEGEFVDVTSETKGRGYQGVFKRWGMHGKQASHGTHEFFRHGGSIGNREFPGRVFKNRKMAGQYGNETVTIQNVKVVKVLADKNIILVHGAVPGGGETYVTIRPAIKHSAQQ